MINIGDVILDTQYAFAFMRVKVNDTQIKKEATNGFIVLEVFDINFSLHSR